MQKLQTEPRPESSRHSKVRPRHSGQIGAAGCLRNPHDEQHWKETSGLASVASSGAPPRSCAAAATRAASLIAAASPLESRHAVDVRPDRTSVPRIDVAAFSNPFVEQYCANVASATWRAP